ncbi:hypothetical protein BT96DRAFT_632905 [Gymnopus androsaceus JB14]|uniref:RING-type domain-containing protein n=1 Tax=Gymnopus androsaceus JB14 TaxID=1447944 RepID=A0A6A4GH37_9AGAR|nr:hypothetical protein BT96DRAFT_632905 [Gymnopus androsaceus JB14]
MTFYPLISLSISRISCRRTSDYSDHGEIKSREVCEDSDLYSSGTFEALNGGTLNGGTCLVAVPDARSCLRTSPRSLSASSNASFKVSTPIPTPLETCIPKSCSICACKPPTLTRLAILAPCGHALRCSCLTSSLIIGGEKDMECVGCRGKVANFKLVSIAADERGSAKSTTTANTTSSKPRVRVFDHMLSAPNGDHFV